MKLEDLRRNCLAVQVFVSGDSRGIGHGVRIIYMEECNGKTITAYTSDGKKHKLRTDSIEVLDVLTASGVKVPWKLEDSKLSFCMEGEWHIACPWFNKGK